jgi:hypothetical protein
MSFFAALTLASVAFYFAIAVKSEELVPMVLGPAATLVFVVLWHLRGPEASFHAADVYWDRAFRGVFVTLGLLAMGGAVAAIGYFSEVHNEKLVLKDGSYASMPMLLSIFGLLAISCFIEAGYRTQRRRQVLKALESGREFAEA